MNTRRLEILGILMIALSVLVLVSLIGYEAGEDPGGISASAQIDNPMGVVGVVLSWLFIKLTFGYSTLILPVLGCVWGWWIFSQRELEKLNRATGYFLAAMVLVSVTIGVVEQTISGIERSDFSLSGALGGVMAVFLHRFLLGSIGAFIVLIVCWLVIIRGYFSLSYYAPIEKWIESIKTKREQKNLVQKQDEIETEKREHTKSLLEKLKLRQEKQEEVTEKAEVEERVTLESEAEDPDSYQDENQMEDSGEERIEVQEISSEFESTEPEDDIQPPERGKKESEIAVSEEVHEEEVDLDTISDRQVPKRKYQLPAAEILTTPINVQGGMSRDELVDRANFLTQSLHTFGVEGKVVNVSPGPVITLFEVEPAEGVRVNKFVALSDDLARVMEASRVRVIAPIPGKSSVGIEIPNRNPDTVYFKSVINSEKFANSKSNLTLAVGKTTSGEIATLELSDMPHLLIAGTTGSGKSVCLNSIICSLLYSCTPDQVKFVIIDPKKVEMTLYRGLDDYHLLDMEDIDEPIVTSLENAILALRSVEKEMERRYNKMADIVVRNISEYNTKMETDGETVMPYIVVVIDELADLMMMNARDVEAPIARLAQLARAVGIHLVVATQRPSVDVITGVIKANFPSRIAFQVATRIDSRTIIDTSGAEKLIGKGDMLYLGSGTSQPTRLHNAFISLEEIEAIMNHVSEQPKAEEYILPTVREGITGGPEVDGEAGRDEMFNEAVRLVITHQQGSISLLQRRLKLGYSRAARLIDEMEQAGIVGPFTGSKAREVLVDETFLESLKY